MEIYEIEWRNIPVTITHKLKWMGGLDHIELRTKEKLPLTETGYRSLFTSEELVSKSGGVISYVTQMLDEASKSKGWIGYEERSKQISLF